MTPARRRLPLERQGIIRRFRVGTLSCYLTVGLYPDGTPGEVFVVSDKIGSSLRALLDSWAIAVSLGLQYGVPLAVIVEKFRVVSFEPQGWTGDEAQPHAASILDYVARWLGERFGGGGTEGTEGTTEGRP